MAVPTTPQPTGMPLANAIILSVGMTVNDDRAEIVMPLASDTNADPARFCESAVEGFYTAMRPGLLDLLPSETSLNFIQAVGASPGSNIPYRRDFVPGVEAGTNGTSAVRSVDGAMIIYYGLFSEPGPSGKLRVAKNFIPGPPESHVTGDNIADSYAAQMDSFAADLVNGYVGSQGEIFYRVVSIEQAGTPPVHNVSVYLSRKYLGTIRRRNLPH